MSVNRPAHTHAPLPEPTTKLAEGWHCLHLYYSIDQMALQQLTPSDVAEGREALVHLLDPERPGAPQRLQTSIVSGHKADLGLMIMDSDPLLIDGIRQAIRASKLGVALKPTYSFVSITEIAASLLHVPLLFEVHCSSLAGSIQVSQSLFGF